MFSALLYIFLHFFVTSGFSGKFLIKYNVLSQLKHDIFFPCSYFVFLFFKELLPPFLFTYIFMFPLCLLTLYWLWPFHVIFWIFCASNGGLVSLKDYFSVYTVSIKCGVGFWKSHLVMDQMLFGSTFSSYSYPIKVSWRYSTLCGADLWVRGPCGAFLSSHVVPLTLRLRDS